VASMSSLAGKSSAYFNHPKGGLSLLLNFGGQWYAGSATCTHRPCTVKYTGPAIYCPCHDGYFNPVNGAVTGGPPPRPLPQYGVLIQNNNLYVTA
jgi:Rieske Fe-S protein